MGIGVATPTAKLEVGGSVEASGSTAELRLRDAQDDLTVRLDATETGGGSVLQMSNDAGTVTAELDAVESSTSRLRLYAGATGTETVRIEAQDNGSSTDGGSIRIYDDTGQLSAHLDGKQSVGGAVLRLYDDIGQALVTIDGSEGTDGAIINLNNEANLRTIELDSHEGSEADGVIRLYDGNGTKNIELVADHTNTFGNVRLYNDAGQLTVELDSQESDNAGEIIIYNAAGTPTIQLDADIGGNSRVITDIVEIRGGSDLSEGFGVRSAKDESPQPGHVVSIDPTVPGELRLSDRSYDARVAGVISGANGVRPGMLMGQRGSIADGDYPVALSGRVYVWADASFGAIQPGDMLTTSSTPGHAMRADDLQRRNGAVLGKAMTALESGRGLVLILVSLQ